MLSCMCMDRMVIKNAECTKRVQIKVAILTVPSEVISILEQSRTITRAAVSEYVRRMTNR